MTTSRTPVVKSKDTLCDLVNGGTSTGYFDPPSPADLTRRSVRGGAVTGSAQITKLLLRLGVTAIIARLLTPHDYGLVAMATVATGFFAVFKDSGLTAATIQRDKIAHEEVSTLFWINAGFGGILSVALVLVAPLIATFFREPRLSLVISVLALTFLFGGLTVQHQALLKRQMRFPALAYIEVLSMCIGAAAAIAMAATGFGYWSLVGMALTIAATNMVAVWCAVPWMPGFPRMTSDVVSLVRFGFDVLAFNVVNFFSRQADNLLIGWYWGAQPLGLYEKAYNLLLLPISQINAPINGVVVPGLSRARNERETFKKHFLGAFEIVSSFSIPVILFIALFADQIVAIWLGEQWMETAVLFRLLAGAALLGALSNPIGWLLMSLGFTRRYRLLGLVSAPLIVGGFALGLHHGPKGVAVAYSIAMSVLFLPAWYWALRGTGIRLRELMGALVPAFLAGCIAIVATLLVAFPKHGNHLSLIESAPAAISFVLIYPTILLIAFKRWSPLANLILTATRKEQRPVTI